MASPTVEPTAKDVTDMSDREIAEETLLWLRSFGQAIQTLQSGGMGAMLKAALGRGK